MLGQLKEILFVSTIVLIYRCQENHCSDDFPVIKTSLGRLRGVWSRSTHGKKYAAFKGIPYAKPPLGELRFEPPQNPDPWKGIRNAGRHGSQCPQLLWVLNEFVGTEDCLYLNVYTPRPRQTFAEGNETAYSLPILFFIHGGSFCLGSGDMDNYLYGPDLFMEAEEVVLVTINYRLGALGFLHLGETVPGNMGLKDQLMALKWVKKNARSFGGNPDRIILMGESAGAASAEYHTLNEESKRMISGVIAQSGSVLTAWAWTRPQVLDRRTKRLATGLGCPNVGRPEDIIRCLKGASYRDIVLHQLATDYSLVQLAVGISFSPTAEPRGTPNSFFEDCPRNVVGNFRSDIPYMTGYNTNEGQFFRKTIAALADSLIKNILMEKLGLKPRNFYSILEYKRGLILETPLPSIADHILGDFEIKVPVLESSRHHASAGAPVYLYHFSFAGRNNFARLFYSGTEPTHMDELTYLFQGRGLFGGLPDVDTVSPEASVSRNMIRMWTNFAKTGNPTPSNDNGESLRWPIGPPRLLVIGEQLTIEYAPSLPVYTALIDKQCVL